MIRIMIRICRSPLKRRQWIILIGCALLTAILNFCFFLYSFYNTFNIIPEEDIIDNLVPLELKKQDICPAIAMSNSDTELPYPSENVSYNVDSFASRLNLSGGEWHPPQCSSRYLVAIVIPYRNRENHLKIFLHYVHPFLQRQNIHYKIYVIEQDEGMEFNRGKLLNVGFVEALKEKPYPCFIFHDVDLLPQNLKNIYACTKYPRHMATSIEKYSHTLPYYKYFGGVNSILSDQFKLVNGFHNAFYGWGGEDDDFLNRVLNAKLRVSRFSSSVSKYYSLYHEQAKPSDDLHETLSKSFNSPSENGLDSLNYYVKEKLQTPTYMKIKVSV